MRVWVYDFFFSLFLALLKLWWIIILCGNTLLQQLNTYWETSSFPTLFPCVDEFSCGSFFLTSHITILQRQYKVVARKILSYSLDTFFLFGSTSVSHLTNNVQIINRCLAIWRCIFSELIYEPYCTKQQMSISHIWFVAQRFSVLSKYGNKFRFAPFWK